MIQIQTIFKILSAIVLAILVPVVVMSGWGHHSHHSAAPTATSHSTLLSANAPAFANRDCQGSYPASLADDDNYGTLWRACGDPPTKADPVWLAYDLSGAATATGSQLGRVVVAWYNDPMSGDYNTQFNHDQYNVPRRYYFQVNPGPGGGPVPTTGWKLAAKYVFHNVFHSRQQVIDMAGENWIRMVVTASNGGPTNQDVALNMDVADASSSPAGKPVNDDWIFYGDSITAAGMAHSGTAPSQSFAQIVNAGNEAYYPIQEDGGTGYLTSSSGASLISHWLSVFPGTYVGISFGTNDMLGGCSPANLHLLYNNYVSMVHAVLHRGLKPVVPTIPWGRTAILQTCVPKGNAQIRALYQKFPAIIHGPDLYTYFKDNQSLISADGIHPTPEGFDAYRSQWADAMLAAVFPAAPVSRQTAAPPITGLHVSGRWLVNKSGKHVILRGVDRSGTEYSCVHDKGIFDGPDDQASVDAMRAWHINAVNLGINEDCWLGINGVNPAFGGQNYRTAIAAYVTKLEADGIYPSISLFWEAPGRQEALAQSSMPDASHAYKTWRSVATLFKNDHRVIFRLKEEPYPGNNLDTPYAWQCWKNGGKSCHEGYGVAGMQSLIDTIRATGAKNVIQVPGIEYANSMSHFLANEPRDPDRNLMAVANVYPYLNPHNTTRYNQVFAPIIKHMPFMVGEFGESFLGNVCSVTGSNTLMNWLDAHHSGYEAWTWDAWDTSCGNLSLILNYDGTPKAPNGTNFKEHLASLAR